MTAPRILALDFDGVLCDGRAEYFETSCRTYDHVWPPLTRRNRRLRERFWRLRPVVMSGWEMPLLLRAIVIGTSERAVLARWPAVREALSSSLSAPHDESVERLQSVLDRVRRDWISVDRAGWLRSHRPYASLESLRRLLALPEHVAIVTTKEGEFARLLLEHWRLPVDDVQGKETGEHKCENLVGLLDRHAAERGEVPSLWFVEDRVETLRCVRECSRRDPRLDAVRLFLAAWGYTTPAARAIARRDPEIRLLTLSRFSKGFAAWPSR